MRSPTLRSGITTANDSGLCDATCATFCTSCIDRRAAISRLPLPAAAARSAPPSILLSHDRHALLIHPQPDPSNARPLAFLVVDTINQTVRQLHQARIRTAHGVNLHRAIPCFALVGCPMEGRGGYSMR